MSNELQYMNQVNHQHRGKDSLFAGQTLEGNCRQVRIDKNNTDNSFTADVFGTNRASTEQSGFLKNSSRKNSYRDQSGDYIQMREGNSHEHAQESSRLEVVNKSATGLAAWATAKSMNTIHDVNSGSLNSQQSIERILQREVDVSTARRQEEWKINDDDLALQGRVIMENLRISNMMKKVGIQNPIILQNLKRDEMSKQNTKFTQKLASASMADEIQKNNTQRESKTKILKNLQMQRDNYFEQSWNKFKFKPNATKRQSLSQSEKKDAHELPDLDEDYPTIPRKNLFESNQFLNPRKSMQSMQKDDGIIIISPYDSAPSQAAATVEQQSQAQYDLRQSFNKYDDNSNKSFKIKDIIKVNQSKQAPLTASLSSRRSLRKGRPEAELNAKRRSLEQFLKHDQRSNSVGFLKKYHNQIGAVSDPYGTVRFGRQSEDKGKKQSSGSSSSIFNKNKNRNIELELIIKKVPDFMDKQSKLYKEKKHEQQLYLDLQQSSAQNNNIEPKLQEVAEEDKDSLNSWRAQELLQQLKVLDEKKIKVVNIDIERVQETIKDDVETQHSVVTINQSETLTNNQASPAPLSTKQNSVNQHSFRASSKLPKQSSADQSIIKQSNQLIALNQQIIQGVIDVEMEDPGNALGYNFSRQESADLALKDKPKVSYSQLELNRAKNMMKRKQNQTNNQLQARIRNNQIYDSSTVRIFEAAQPVEEEEESDFKPATKEKQALQDESIYLEEPPQLQSSNFMEVQNENQMRAGTNIIGIGTLYGLDNSQGPIDTLNSMAVIQPIQDRDINIQQKANPMTLEEHDANQSKILEILGSDPGTEDNGSIKLTGLNSKEASILQLSMKSASESRTNGFSAWKQDDDKSSTRRNFLHKNDGCKKDKEGILIGSVGIMVGNTQNMAKMSERRFQYAGRDPEKMFYDSMYSYQNQYTNFRKRDAQWAEQQGDDKIGPFGNDQKQKQNIILGPNMDIEQVLRNKQKQKFLKNINENGKQAAPDANIKSARRHSMTSERQHRDLQSKLFVQAIKNDFAQPRKSESSVKIVSRRQDRTSSLVTPPRFLNAAKAADHLSSHQSNRSHSYRVIKLQSQLVQKKVPVVNIDYLATAVPKDPKRASDRGKQILERKHRQAFLQIAHKSKSKTIVPGMDPAEHDGLGSLTMVNTERISVDQDHKNYHENGTRQANRAMKGPKQSKLDAQKGLFRESREISKNDIQTKYDVLSENLQDNRERNQLQQPQSTLSADDPEEPKQQTASFDHPNSGCGEDNIFTNMIVSQSQSDANMQVADAEIHQSISNASEELQYATMKKARNADLECILGKPTYADTARKLCSLIERISISNNFNSSKVGFGETNNAAGLDKRSKEFMDKVMFKHKPYSKMSFSERIYHNQSRKHKLELADLHKYNKLLANMTKQEYMYKGVHSTRLHQAVDDVDRVRQRSPSSNMSDTSNYMKDDLYEEKIATRKIDIPLLANSLQTIYKSKNQFGQAKFQHVRTSRLRPESLPSQREVDLQRKKLEIQKSFLTTELMELIAKHPEIQENLRNLDQILQVENLPYIPQYSNAMSPRKTQSAIKKAQGNIKHLKEQIKESQAQIRTTKEQNLNLFAENKQLAIDVGNGLASGQELRARLSKLNEYCTNNTETILIIDAESPAVKEQSSRKANEDIENFTEVKAYQDQSIDYHENQIQQPRILRIPIQEKVAGADINQTLLNSQQIYSNSLYQNLINYDLQEQLRQATEETESSTLATKAHREQIELVRAKNSAITSRLKMYMNMIKEAAGDAADH